MKLVKIKCSAPSRNAVMLQKLIDVMTDELTSRQRQRVLAKWIEIKGRYGAPIGRAVA